MAIANVEKLYSSMLPLALNTSHTTQRFTLTRAGTIASPRFSARILLTTPDEFASIRGLRKLTLEQYASDGLPSDAQIHCKDIGWTSDTRYCTGVGYYVPGNVTSLLHLFPGSKFEDGLLSETNWQGRLRTIFSEDTKDMQKLCKQIALRAFCFGGYAFPTIKGGVQNTRIDPEVLNKLKRQSSLVHSGAKKALRATGIPGRRISQLWGASDPNKEIISSVIIDPRYDEIVVSPQYFLRDNRKAGMFHLSTIADVLRNFRFVHIAKGDVLVGTDGEIKGPFRKGHPAPKARSGGRARTPQK